ncbi:MAG TPA: amidohydrolase family protein [Candidatus Blautia merdigallinarum]|uniref:Amidohydrolase family protein n=1 Tax=Candidatus Blautia merdigallinarum TaxID=2838495 RepID=A0A9D2N559_9FIRM|nr:amidohydrolase family protein [Candidatus Blautia merdigallinarum]
MFGENHAHIFMNALDYRQAVKDHEKVPDEKLIREHLKAYQEKNVSFVRDGGDYLGVSQKAREIALEYGIDYRTPIFAIHKKGHYGGIVGRAFETMKEYAALVREVKKEGGDFIKIMTTGIMDFDTDGSITGAALSFEEVREMVHIAHEEGFSVMSHTNGARAVKEAAMAGADSIEHGNYADEEALKIMAEKGTIWVPTITVVKNLIGKGRFSDQVLLQIWEKGKTNIRKGYELGVNLALGSDAGAYLVPHGQGIMDEWACFREILGDKEDLKERLLRGEYLIQGKFRKV